MLTTVGQVTSFKASQEFFDKVEAEDKEIKLFKVGCASMRIAYQTLPELIWGVAGRLPRAGAGAGGGEGGVCGRVHFVGAETRRAGDVEAVGGVERGRRRRRGGESISAV